ncbi:MAG: helix-turn-helix domain-containing protein [Geminicoccaceae bacterium]
MADELSAEAAVFRAAAGCPPLAILTELRLALTRRRLLGGKASMAQIAAEVGYQSEAALRRALHRRFGLRPGEIRRSGVPSVKGPAAGSVMNAC